MGFIKSNIEKVTLFLLGLSFFIGIWHALPMLNVINDEMYFVGGVLRAMESHSILPVVNDVPYGTITYFLNYILFAVFLMLALPFFRFDLLKLKTFLVQSPEWAYLIPRFLSACLALIMLFLFYRFLKKEFEDKKVRLFLLILLFTNIITALILHTGKMWVLSTLLVILSFFYLYRALQGKDGDQRRLTRNILLSILFSFLALANFPLNLYSLINLPILFFFFRKDRKVCFAIIKYFIIGLVVFIIVTLTNFSGIKNQIISVFTDFHPMVTADQWSLSVLAKSFSLYFIKLIRLFPLLIITLLLALKSKVRNRNLLVLSIIYFIVNFVTISVAANGAYLGLTSKLRYLFQLGFFLVLAIASFDLKFSKKLYIIGGISLVYYIFTIYCLSVPTTYNQAYEWIKNNYGNQEIVIVNKTLGVQLQLPKNKKSYLLIDEKYCATKCLNTLEYDLNSDFKPVVIDEKSRETIDVFALDKDLYFIESAATSSKKVQLVKFFGNKINDSLYYSVDSNMGNYFDLNYFKIKNLGSNIYIYKYQK